MNRSSVDLTHPTPALAVGDCADGLLRCFGQATQLFITRYSVVPHPAASSGVIIGFLPDLRPRQWRTAGVKGEREDAVRRGSIDQLQRLLASGADIDARDGFGQTALMLAAREGHTKVVEWLVESYAGNWVTRLIRRRGEPAIL
jgi:hypothetical protein